MELLVADRSGDRERLVGPAACPLILLLACWYCIKKEAVLAFKKLNKEGRVCMCVGEGIKKVVKKNGQIDQQQENWFNRFLKVHRVNEMIFDVKGGDKRWG